MQVQVKVMTRDGIDRPGADWKRGMQANNVHLTITITLHNFWICSKTPVMVFLQPQTSREKYLHPHSAAAPHEKRFNATSSQERLMSPSLVTIPLQHSSHASSSKITSTISNKTSPSNPSSTSWPGHPRTPPRKPQPRIDEHVLALSVTITLAILVLIGVPLGAILPKKYVVPLPVNILVPFYIYPDAGAWDRLFEACIKHPDTNFTVILSIDNGPGTTVWPAGIYINPTKRLNTLSNVQAIGYVDTNHASRDREAVLKEIALYAGWNNSGIAISGIFFDRTPTEDVNDARAYLKNVSATVRHLEGFLKPEIVVHNMGKVPDENITGYHADVTVVFDGEYGELPDRKVLREKLRGLKGRREDYGEVVHSVPRTLSRGGVRKIVNRARRNVGWLFVTDRMGDNRYECYSDRWEEFLDLTW